jgi:hypothetical protein
MKKYRCSPCSDRAFIKIVRHYQNSQSWARAFFKASRLRFRAPGGSSSRLRFRAFFLALNFALLRSRFRAPALLDFSRSFFALLDFSRSSIFRALFRAPRFFALLFSRSSIFAIVISCSCVFLRPGQDSQDRTARTGHPEQDKQNWTVRTGQQERDRQNKTTMTG